MHHKLKLGGAIFALCAMASAAFASDAIAPGDIKIQEGQLAKSLTGQKGDPVAGKKWFTGRKMGNCLACHVNKDTSVEQFHGEIGPPMDGVASRYEEAQLRAIVVNSKLVFGDETLMPAFYRVSGLNRVHKKFKAKTILSAQQVEDVVAYLMTLKEE